MKSSGSPASRERTVAISERPAAGNEVYESDESENLWAVNAKTMS